MEPTLHGDDAELRRLRADLEAALAEATPADSSSAHRRVAGVLTMVAAGLVLLVAAGYMAAVVLFSPAAGEDLWVAGPSVGLAVVLSLVIAGTAWGFLRGAPWARVPLAIIAVLSLPFLPLGTALGCYLIYTLVVTGRSG